MLADIAFEFPIDIGSGHWPSGEAGRVVDLTRNPLPIGEDGRHARGDRSSGPRSERRVFGDLDLLHEGKNRRIAKLLRCKAFVGDIAVEHRSRRDVGKAVVGSLPGSWRPLLRLAAGPLVAPAGRRDLDRRDTIK